MKFILMFFVIIGINIGLSDANAAEPGTKVWSDVAELSFVKTGGNTDVENLLINNALKYLFSSSVTGNWNLHILNGETNNIIRRPPKNMILSFVWIRNIQTGFILLAT